jgi:ribosomal protein S18 acetylase RimI-like enzyme
MRAELPVVPPAPRWPQGVEPRVADPAADAPAIHALLVDAFARSAEEVPPFDEWLTWWTSDPSFDPAAWFLASDPEGLAGVALCWGDGFLKDLAVRPSSRRRGLGEALLRHAFRELALRGHRSVSLKVDAANPTGALRLYERVGMRVAERLEVEVA